MTRVALEALKTFFSILIERRLLAILGCVHVASKLQDRHFDRTP